MPDGLVILGAGLAGLSTAYHFGKGCQVFEAEDVPGGLLRTREVGGFSFDYTGHLLHLKDPYARGLVAGLMKGNLAEHRRRARIYSKGVMTDYPFQAIARHRRATGPRQTQAIAAWPGTFDRLGSIESPTLVVTGTEDVIAPPENAFILAQRINGSWLVQFNGAGHGLMYQYPDRLAKIVEDFIELTD